MSLTDDTKYNPIHTIPAPNLNKNLAYTTNMKYVQEPFDNQLSEKDQFNQYPYRPLNVSSKLFNPFPILLVQGVNFRLFHRFHNIKLQSN